MDFRLEVVAVPVSDVDRAKAFYSEKVGFNLDHDVSPTDQMRVVQLTPPGSACSIVIGTGPEGSTGSKFVFFNDPDGNGWAVQEVRAP